jgi:uncharacterized protein DUF4062
MPKPRVRYQVFVSSTYNDLRDERQAAVEAILRAGHVPAGMELFAAQNRPQMEVIKEWIEESDIFCLILGARYGSLNPEGGKSYVESEYDHAMALSKPIFSIVLDERAIDANLARLGRKVVLEQENESLWKAFRQRITNTLVRSVAGPDSIKVAVFEAIASLERSTEIDGWVRAKDARVSPEVGEELARLSAENSRLTKELATASRAHEALVDGRSIKEWGNVLASMAVNAWDTEKNAIHPKQRVTLHACLLQYGSLLGAGVENSYSASQHTHYLFQIASALASLGLAETLKTPSDVHWQRLGLSSSGKKLYAALVAQQTSGDATIAVADLSKALLDTFSKPAADVTTPSKERAPKISNRDSEPKSAKRSAKRTSRKRKASS